MSDIVKYQPKWMTPVEERMAVPTYKTVSQSAPAEAVPAPMPLGAPPYRGVPSPPNVQSLPRRLDLMRQCAAHEGHLWASVFVLNAYGIYDYTGNGVVITDAMRRTQYAPGLAEALNLTQPCGQETCPCCGVTGFLFKCVQGHIVCGGLSTGLYMRCFCGGEGLAVPQTFQHVAFAPKMLGNLK